MVKVSSVVERFSRLYMGDQGIEQISIDLIRHQIIVQIDEMWVLRDERTEWNPDLPIIRNAQLVFVGCDLVTICPQDSALDGLVLRWDIVPIEQRGNSWRSARYRFEFLIIGDPSPVTLRIEADDFQLVSGEGDSAEIPFENRD